MGGYVPLGYDVQDRKLVINEAEAASVRRIFERFVGLKGGISLGLWPAPVVDVMHASVDNLLQHISVSKL